MDEKQAMETARKVLGSDEVSVSYGEGWDGVGWYGWSTDYPEDGAVRLDDANET